MNTRPKGYRNGDPYKWTPEAEDLVSTYLGAMNPEHIAGRLTRELGYEFTANAVVQHSKREMGIHRKDNQGDLTISEAARQLGITVYTLHFFIKTHGLEVTGTGKYRFVTADTYRAAQAYYVKPPEPTVSVIDAAKRLNYSVDSIHKAIKAQRLRAWRFGKLWCVAVADVERWYWDIARGKGLNDPA